MKCGVVRDLIPLYIDGCLSDESIVLVEEHLEHCDECKGLLQIMKASTPLQEVEEKIPAEPMERVSVWKASVLQAVLQFVSFLLIVLGVTMEAYDKSSENGFWATGLIVPATGFMLSLINWYFVRLYRDRGRFSVISSVCTLIIIIAGYVWAAFHYEISLNGSYLDFKYLGLLYGIPISIILCILSGVFADKYGKLIGKERMKLKRIPEPKMFTLLASFFCVVNSFTPLSIIVTALAGYTFDIRSYLLWTLLQLLLSGLLAVLMYRFENRETSKADRILLTVALFMSLLNWGVCLFTGANDNYAHNAILIGVLIALFAVTAFVSIIYIKQHKKWIVISTIKVICAGLLASLLVYLSFIVIIFSGIGQNTVVKTAESPTGRYTAELVDSNQGALGGATVVYVTDNLLSVDFGLVTVHKQKEMVYMGEWGAYEGLTLRWIDKDTLKVGGNEYDMK